MIKNIIMFIVAQAIFVSFAMYVLHVWSIQGGAI